VTAFAAHELRTPLAGLKVQAQVAMAATDPDVAKNGFRYQRADVDLSQGRRLPRGVEPGGVEQLADEARVGTNRR
jgi:signal transduction histidine kinase